MLKSREDLNNIRNAYAKTLESQKTKILVCAGTGCVASGSLEIFECLKDSS
jgi:NADH-quinone oxidoreductase subunit F